MSVIAAPSPTHDSIIIVRTSMVSNSKYFELPTSTGENNNIICMWRCVVVCRKAKTPDTFGHTIITIIARVVGTPYRRSHSRGIL